MADRIIYHLLKLDDWQAAERAGYYLGSAADRRDGFIHFSTASQVEASAARYHAGEPNLVLLAVDTARLGADLKWEPSGAGDLFPHLYTRMPLSAVVGVRTLTLGPDGRHRIPPLGPDGFK